MIIRDFANVKTCLLTFKTTKSSRQVRGLWKNKASAKYFVSYASIEVKGLLSNWELGGLGMELSAFMVEFNGGANRVGFWPEMRRPLKASKSRATCVSRERATVP